MCYFYASLFILLSSSIVTSAGSVPPPIGRKRPLGQVALSCAAQKLAGGSHVHHANMNDPITIIVFSRLPIPGRCKTRLAAGVGNDAAADFYRVCAEHAVAEAVRMAHHRAVVYCSSADEQAAVLAWLQAAGLAVAVKPQTPDLDLGLRMLHAMRQEADLLAAAFAATPHGVVATKEHNSQSTPTTITSLSTRHPATVDKRPAPATTPGVLLIGSDIPSISAQVLQAAATALAFYDLVLGPAADGGYYLIGLSAAALQHRPLVRGGQLFQGVSWSTSQVLQQQVAAAKTCGLTIAPLGTLPTLQDIDVVQDAITWLQQQGLSVGPPQPNSLGQRQSMEQTQQHTEAGPCQTPGASNQQHAAPDDNTPAANPRLVPAEQPQPQQGGGEEPADPLKAQHTQRPEAQQLEEGCAAGSTAGHSLQRVQEAAQRMLQAAGVRVPA